MASSFSRKAPNPNDGKSKKIVMCGVLGAVLVGLLIHQFGGAKSTEASTSDSNQTAAPEIVTDTPASVLAALEEKTGAKNAGGAAKSLVALEAAPADPFRISEVWLTKLSHPVAVKPPQTPIEIPQHVTPVKPQVEEVKTPVKQVEPPVAVSKWEPSALKLNGIYREGDKFLAFINGSVCTEGTVIGGAKIIEITTNKVTVQQADNPKGQLYSLTINMRK